MPERVLDLFAEFRCLTNGKAKLVGNGLVDALIYYGLPHIDIGEKQEMRALSMRGGPFTADEMRALIEYCWTDVIALERVIADDRPL